VSRLDEKEQVQSSASGDLCNPVALVSSSVFSVFSVFSVVKRIRVNPFEQRNPCDYSFVCCTHQLKLAVRPDESSVTGLKSICFLLLSLYHIYQIDIR
jgi:hypothetical protein